MSEEKQKAETTFPNAYNQDFDRMHKQFNKYLQKESIMQSSSNPSNFEGDPMKQKDPSISVRKQCLIS